MVIVVGIVMVMVYSALDRNLIFAADSMYTRVKSNAKEVYMMQQWERYGYVDYVPYSDYMRQLVRDDEIPRSSTALPSPLATRRARTATRPRSLSGASPRNTNPRATRSSVWTAK